jgi:hypothetical protein
VVYAKQQGLLLRVKMDIKMESFFYNLLCKGGNAISNCYSKFSKYLTINNGMLSGHCGVGMAQ